jgi:hypothetical protein
LKESLYNKDLQNEYSYVVVLLQTRVPHELTRAKEQLKSWEKEDKIEDKIRYSKTIFNLLKKE